MQLKLPPPAWMHGMCIGAIVLWSFWLLRQVAEGRDGTTQQSLQACFRMAANEAKKDHEVLAHEIAMQAARYSNVNNREYNWRAEVLLAKSDSMVALLNDLGNYFSPERLFEVQGKLNVFRSEVLEMGDRDRSINEHLPKFSPADWLFQHWKKDSREQFLTTLERTKAEVRMAESVVMVYCQNKVGKWGEGLWFNTHQPVFVPEILGATVGDSLNASVFLSSYSDDLWDAKIALSLDGQNMGEGKDGEWKFTKRYARPGLHPLRVLVEIESFRQPRDTVENTFWVRTRE